MDVCQIAPGFLGQKAMFAFSAGHGDSAPARRMRKVIPAMVIAVMVFAGLTARFWATRLIGRDFADVGLIILVLAIGGGALAWETVAVQEVNAKGYPLRLTFVWLACLCAALALMLVLIPSFGAIGAASAVSASFLMLAAMIYRLRKRTRKEASDAEPEVKRP
jgi:O-antigen/teichoic acid export membrane protein